MSVAAAALIAAAGKRAGADRVIRVRASGFVRRFVAAAIDVGLIGGLSAGVTVGAAVFLRLPLPTTRELGPDLLLAGVLDRSPLALGGVGLFVGLAFLYELYFGGVVGQTLGKRLLHLRVLSVRGEAPGPARGAMRLLAMVPSLAPAGLGWLWALFDREHRALHDHLAGTYVIVDR